MGKFNEGDSLMLWPFSPFLEVCSVSFIFLRLIARPLLLQLVESSFSRVFQFRIGHQLLSNCLLSLLVAHPPCTRTLLTKTHNGALEDSDYVQ